MDQQCPLSPSSATDRVETIRLQGTVDSGRTAVGTALLDTTAKIGSQMGRVIYSGRQEEPTMDVGRLEGIACAEVVMAGTVRATDQID